MYASDSSQDILCVVVRCEQYCIELRIASNITTPSAVCLQGVCVIAFIGYFKLIIVGFSF